MNVKSMEQLKPAPTKNFIGCLVGQCLGCLGAYLLAQIAALLLPVILNPLFENAPGLHGLITWGLTGCTCLGSMLVALGVSVLVTRKFPLMLRQPRGREEEQQ